MIARPYQRVAWWPRVSLCREFCKRRQFHCKMPSRCPIASGPKISTWAELEFISELGPLKQWASLVVLSFFIQRNSQHFKYIISSNGPPLLCSYLANKTSTLNAAGMAELPWSALTPGWCRRLSLWLGLSSGDSIPHAHKRGWCQ